MIIIHTHFLQFLNSPRLVGASVFERGFFVDLGDGQCGLKNKVLFLLENGYDISFLECFVGRKGILTKD